MKPLSIMSLLMLPFFASVSLAAPVADDVLGTLYGMRTAYRSSYAPADWKKKISGYDLETEFAKATSRVQLQPNMTVAEARGVFKDFIYSMQDYHTSISFALTEKATLPFIVKGAGNRVFIVHIDRTKLSEQAFPFQVGDEVISFAGKPVADVIASLQAEIPTNVPQTDRALAEQRLTKREAARGYSVPQGPVNVAIQRKGAAQATELQLIWEYVPERVGNRNTWNARLSLNDSSSLFHPMMDVKLASTSAENPYDLGAKKTYTPDLGVKVWEAPKDNAFDAYIYKAPDRRLIGYVRIQGYIMPDYQKAVTDFAAIIRQFESTTDAMVIDQVNNPGGSVFYLYSLVSMLADKPMKTPRHRMSVDQADVVQAVELADKLRTVKNDEDASKILEKEDMDGYPSTYQAAQFALSYAEFISSEWSAGRRLTTPYWIGGVDEINPAPTHYTKPVLVLINNLDFSGGDFFPTILQDNQRATIMGSRTAGAGGYVKEIKIPNSVGVKAFRTTASIAERLSGNPIENLGVTPDVTYEHTVDDLQSNYAPYVKAINTTILSLIK